MSQAIRTLRSRLGPPTWEVRDLPSDEAQAQALWGKVLEDTGHPLLVDFISRLIEIGNIPARDPARLARALQLFSINRIKFFRERPETFRHSLRTVAMGIGDCDDKARFIASSLRSFRVPTRLKFIRISIPMKNGTVRKLGHVYPLAYINGKWVALESVRMHPMGYDPEARAKKRGFEVSTYIIGDKPDDLHA